MLGQLTLLIADWADWKPTEKGLPDVPEAPNCQPSLSISSILS